MTRTDAIRAAIMTLLEARRTELDAAAGLRSLTIDLKFSPDCLEPRDVVDRMERERRKQSRPA